MTGLSQSQLIQGVFSSGREGELSDNRNNRLDLRRILPFFANLKVYLVEWEVRGAQDVRPVWVVWVIGVNFDCLL